MMKETDLSKSMKMVILPYTILVLNMLNISYLKPNTTTIFNFKKVFWTAV